MIQDLRLALRLLLKSPGFSAVAILTLGLGIGANTAIFSFINAFFLQPLPVQRADELVALFTADERYPGSLPVSYLNFRDYEAQNQVFDGMLAYSFVGANTLINSEPAILSGQAVSGNFFDLLGLPAALGRTFRAEEYRTIGTHPVVVVSYDFWRTRLGADPAVINRTLPINGTAFTIIGVAPAGFRGLNTFSSTDFWVTTASYKTVAVGVFASYYETNRRALIMQVVGRLKPGVSLEQAAAGLQPIAAELARQYPDANRGRSLQLVPLSLAGINPSQRQTYVQAGALLLSLAGLVLLITCGNLANLLLARATARQREVAVRLALGAHRGRLIRQFLTESLLLSLLGGAAGLFIAHWTRDLLWTLRPPGFATSVTIGLDARVLGFALGVTLLTGLIFGLAPAWTATKPQLTTMLKEDAKGSAPTPLLSVRNFLVAAQLALSVIALIVAGLFIRSLDRAQRVDPGWKTENLANLSVNTTAQGYSDPRSREFSRRAIERLAAVPGVTSVTLANNLLLNGGGNRLSVIPQGTPDEKLRTSGTLIYYQYVSPGYFDFLGMRLIAGRDVGPADDLDHLNVAVINESFARLCWPGEDAIGKIFRVFGQTNPVQIVGLVRDANYNDVGEAPIPYLFLSIGQDTRTAGSLSFHVRTAGDVGPQLNTLRRELQALDPALPIINVSTMADHIRERLWGARTGAALLALFGLLALLLSAIGVYSIMSYTVGLRTREIGIRMAIGAQASDVLSLVLGRGLIVVGAGIVAGIVAAVSVTRYFENLLFGISATDPFTFALITVLLAVVALIACYVPARRATKVDPLVALRSE